MPNLWPPKHALIEAKTEKLENVLKIEPLKLKNEPQNMQESEK